MFSKFPVRDVWSVPGVQARSAEITDRLTRSRRHADDTTVPAIGGWVQRVTDATGATSPSRSASSWEHLNAFARRGGRTSGPGRCPSAGLAVAEDHDLDDGRVRVRRGVYRKQPDWTYVQSPAETAGAMASRRGGGGGGPPRGALMTGASEPLPVRCPGFPRLAETSGRWIPLAWSLPPVAAAATWS